MEVLEKANETEIFIGEGDGVKQDVDAVLNKIGDMRSDCGLVVNGKTIDLSHESSRLLLNILEALSAGTRIRISTTPREVSASTAAEMLGVSRPTFLKWAKNNSLNPVNVGSQQRWLTEDVLELRKTQRNRKLEAFNKLRKELDALEM